MGTKKEGKNSLPADITTRNKPSSRENLEENTNSHESRNAGKLSNAQHSRISEQEKLWIDLKNDDRSGMLPAIDLEVYNELAGSHGDIAKLHASLPDSFS